MPGPPAPEPAAPLPTVEEFVVPPMPALVPPLASAPPTLVLPPRPVLPPVALVPVLELPPVTAPPLFPPRLALDAGEVPPPLPEAPTLPAPVAIWPPLPVGLEDAPPLPPPLIELLPDSIVAGVHAATKSRDPRSECVVLMKLSFPGPRIGRPGTHKPNYAQPVGCRCPGRQLGYTALTKRRLIASSIRTRRKM